MALFFSTGNTWVIDFGATDYMTNNFSLIISLESLSVKSIQVANRTLMLITGAENVFLSHILSLLSVLLAPTLSNNLLFIS